MMNPYSRHILEIVVAQICETVGWHSIQSTPLELLIDLLHRHISMIASSLRSYTELFGRTDCNLNDLGLVFYDNKILVSDLEEYIQYVESVPYPGSVPKYPISKESHLNFLKPGSKEVLTRPVHIHEYLPPIHPSEEDEKPNCTPGSSEMVTGTSPPLSDSQSPDKVFKKPVEPSYETPLKRARLTDEEHNSRPTREISSVMMTTSGFISPAREGKLPEPRSPMTLSENVNVNPIIATPNIAQPELTKDDKKLKKTKSLHNSKNREREKKRNRDLFKADKPTIVTPVAPTSNDSKRKKVVSMKEVLKNKALKTGVVKTDVTAPAEIIIDEEDVKPIDFTMTNTHKNSPKISTPLNLVKDPIENNSVNSVSSVPVEEQVEKLPTGTTAPNDRQKLNIFKKKSKWKDDKFDPVVQESKIVDPEPAIEVVDQKPAITVQKIHIDEDNDKTSPIIKSELYDDDLSLPSTPSVPRTPDVVASPPLKVEKDKKKKKDKIKSKKLKSLKNKSPKPSAVADHQSGNVDMDPAAAFMKMPYSPFANSPSLIPNPGLFSSLLASSANKAFPRFPLAVHSGFPSFGQPPHMSHMPPMPPMPMFVNKKPDISETKLSEIPAPMCNVPPLLLPELRDELPGKPAKLAKLANVEPGHPDSVPVEDRKKDREHKKDRKDKEEKSKKKKDKKDKVKNKDKDKKKDKDKDRKKEKKDKKREERESEGAIPKLTLKLGPMDSTSPRPSTPDSTGSRKITIKPVIQKDEKVTSSVPQEQTREPSPELAKISALFTRPSKPKIPKPPAEESHADAVTPMPSGSVAAPTNAIHSREGKPHKAGKALDTLDNATRSQAPPTKSVDQFGNEVWICPACSRQDDGSPMIGCDDCDAWYHWVCVGIQIPPDTNEDWYCNHCIQRKQKQSSLDDGDKKRKRKKSKKSH